MKIDKIALKNGEQEKKKIEQRNKKKIVSDGAEEENRISCLTTNREL